MGQNEPRWVQIIRNRSEMDQKRVHMIRNGSESNQKWAHNSTNFDPLLIQF